jgi:hypothetical protein
MDNNNDASPTRGLRGTADHEPSFAFIPVGNRSRAAAGQRSEARAREAEKLMRRVKEAELRYRGSASSGNVRGSSDTHGIKRFADPQLTS